MDDDDDHVSVGTAFPVLETEEDLEKAKRKKDKEQYVLDKQGRRRFHGAFTGGFSAGYYNTVGTKEGAAPSARPANPLSPRRMGSLLLRVVEIAKVGRRGSEAGRIHGRRGAGVGSRTRYRCFP